MRRNKLERNLSFVAFNDADDVQKEHWDEVLGDKNHFLDINYLKILDTISPKNFQTRYVIIYNHDEPFDIVYFQVIDFKA